MRASTYVLVLANLLYLLTYMCTYGRIILLFSVSSAVWARSTDSRRALFKPPLVPGMFLMDFL